MKRSMLCVVCAVLVALGWGRVSAVGLSGVGGQPLVTIELEDAEPRSVLSLLAREGGIAIAVVGELRGRVSVSARRRPAEFVLNWLAEAKGWQITRLSSTTFVLHEKNAKFEVFGPVAKSS